MQFIKDKLFGTSVPTTEPVSQQHSIQLREQMRAERQTPAAAAAAKVENGSVYRTPVVLQLSPKDVERDNGIQRPPRRPRSVTMINEKGRAGGADKERGANKLSPSESFHSSTSTIVPSPHQGIANPAFAGSTDTLSTVDGARPRERPTRVIREQYWSWSCLCLCSNWSRREKIFAFVIFFLILVITGLVSGIGLLYDRNQKLTLQL